MKQVREGINVTAFVILRKNGQHVATVHIKNTADSSRVDVWNQHPEKGRPNPTATQRDAAEEYGPQQGRATRYGYDREVMALAGLEIDGWEVMALAGLEIDGWEMVGHCTPGRPGALDVEPSNCRNGKATTWHTASGLKRLEKRGYQVIRAI